MNDLQIAVNPAKPYTALDVLEALESGATYRPGYGSERQVRAALNGLQHYFAEHCREAAPRRPKNTPAPAPGLDAAR